MTVTFSPAPKPLGRLDQDAKLAAKVERLRQRKRQRKPLKAKAWMKRGTKPLQSRAPIAKVNRARQAKRYAAYRKMIASPFNKQLRVRAFERSGGLCECEDCTLIRGNKTGRLYGAMIADERRRMAWTPVPAWFVAGGAEPWRRFRSTAGQLHHLRYSRAEREDPEALQDVQWTWTACHYRIEAEHSTRRNYLRGKTNA